MDRRQAEELARWAEQLKEADDAEKRAAGRAIQMLLGELERTEQPPPGGPPRERKPGPVPGPEPEAEAEAEADERPEPDPRAEARARREAARKQKRRRGLFRFAIALSALGALVYAGLAVGAMLAAPNLRAAGPAEGARVGPVGLPKLRFSVAGNLDNVQWKLDGADVTQRARLVKGRIVFDGSGLRDGEHVLKASSPGGFPGARSTKTWRFAVDTTGPTITLVEPAGRIPSGEPLRVRGVLEPGAALTVDGRPVLVRKDGRFVATWTKRPLRPVLFAATDALRNTSTKQVTVGYVPRLPPFPLRAVHVTADAWADDDLRAGVLALIDEGRINTVELDLKDEGGIVGFGPNLPRVRAVDDAWRATYDLAAAVKVLHAKGVRVVGRLVCFLDPKYAQDAWRAGRRNEVVRTADGGLYVGTYGDPDEGGFTNFANPAVRKYQIDIAIAAAKAGVDEILYDYVRRPDGPISSMAFPGLRTTPERGIEQFLVETRRALRPYKTFIGASVFGIAATRPLEIAQDIPSMAEHLDYVAPMLYPSHWGPGEYGVDNPNAQPYDIIRRSLDDFVAQVRGTGARVVPWLQDFSLGVTYGPDEVAAQIRGARDAGVHEWLLWDPNVSYTADALSRDARRAKFSKQSLVTPTIGTLKPNELGLVPVLMHHQIRSDGGGEFDLTPAEFRGQLERLHRNGYVPVRAIDLVTGNLNVPYGKTPVVMTFDDSTKEQFSLLPDGTPKPDTAIGIWLAYQKENPDFPMAGTFYPNREPFAGVAEGAQMLRWLHAHGFEIGNHTHDHIALSSVDDTEVQKQLVTGRRLILQAVPNARVRTLALPLGEMPDNPALAVSGSWNGESYRHEGVFLAGAEPSPSPYALRFDPGAIPRIRTTHYDTYRGEQDFTAGQWLAQLEKEPGLRYVSDGDPRTITIPGVLADKLKPQYRSRAKTY